MLASDAKKLIGVDLLPCVHCGRLDRLHILAGLGCVSVTCAACGVDVGRDCGHMRHLDSRDVMRRFVHDVWNQLPRHSPGASERTQFEAVWSKQYDGPGDFLLRHHTMIEQYANHDTQRAWEGWKACSAHRVCT